MNTQQERSKLAKHFLTRIDRPTAYLLLLVALYLASRLYTLTALPVFIDEAEHIHWAKFEPMGAVSQGRFLSVLLTGIFMTLPLNDLLLGRLTSVLVGLFVLGGYVAVGKKLYFWREGIIAAGLYTLLPYNLFYDRLALAHNLMIALGTWSVVLTLSTLRSSRRSTHALLGLGLAGSILAKLSGAVLILIPPLGALTLPSQKDRRRRFRQILPPVLVAGAMIFVLVLGGYGSIILSRNDPHESTMLSTARTNLENVADWFWTLLTPPVALLAVVAFASLAWYDRDAKFLFLAGFFLATSIPYIAGVKFLFPRYLLFSLLPLSLIIARFLSIAGTYIITRRKLPLLVLVLPVIVWPTLVDISILNDPANAPITETNRKQFISSWPSGYGLPEMAGYLQLQAEEAPEGINLLTIYQTYWELQIYLEPSDAITGYEINNFTEPGMAAVTSEIIASRRPTFIALELPRFSDSFHAYKELLTGADFTPRRVWRYEKLDGESALELWRIDP